MLLVPLAVLKPTARTRAVPSGGIQSEYDRRSLEQEKYLNLLFLRMSYVQYSHNVSRPDTAAIMFRTSLFVTQWATRFPLPQTRTRVTT